MPTPTDHPPLRGVRFPLSVKILMWFFLNLAFLGGAGWLAARGQLRMGLDSLIAGPVNDRLQTMGAVVSQQLNERPPARWDQILQNTANAYHLQVALFRNDGGLVAGHLELPEEVRNRLREIRPGRRPEDPPPPNGERGEPPPRRDGPPGDPSPDAPRRNGEPPPNGERSPNGERPPPRPPPMAIQGSFPKMMLHTSAPSLYWVLIRMPVVDRHKPSPAPTTLILATDSLRGGGLLFDYRPWLIGGGIVLLVSVLLWVPLVRGITRTLRQMTGAAESIARGRFDTHLDMRRSDELGRLGSALNHMSARLREFFTGQKRFLGDIAHELCSPLARMEMALGILDQRADEKQRNYVADVREELRHMSELVHELLSFSKAGVGGKNVELVPVSLAELTGRVVARETKERGGVVVDVPSTLTALAEPDLLGRALGNVIRNALRYASPTSAASESYSYRPTVQSDGRPSGPITVSARDCGEHISLLVTDCGPGVPEEALHRLFDPFFRPESARTRETGGTGLGLAIVRSCVEACGGSVAVRNVKPSGLQVEFELRCAPSQPDPKIRLAAVTA
ncbi:MAG: HAMP domain-containing sensor histidine kinase [Chthoniobacter sp.]|uniref:sensor histidine kinase n=1 Tax=Chthoniobacter sp. TaxID=2510640 RepID=UPI0032A24657